MHPHYKSYIPIAITKTLLYDRKNVCALHCGNLYCIWSRLIGVHIQYFRRLNATTKTLATNARHRAMNETAGAKLNHFDRRVL